MDDGYQIVADEADEINDRARSTQSRFLNATIDLVC
jgi:hypothetical protein